MVTLQSIKTYPKYLLGSAGPSGFSSGTTAARVADVYESTIKGHVFVVTGSNTGIGKETAKVLAVRGGIVYMLCRDIKKTEEAAAEIRAAYPKADVRLVPCDLSSLQSTRAAADAVIRDNLPIFALINNAGIMACDEGTTEDGIETQFGTNVVGHYLLTKLLLPQLRKGGSQDAPARVVNVASEGHRMPYRGGVQYDRTCRYDRWQSYGQSKLGNVLYARALQKHFEANNDPIVSVSLHPGVIQTELTRHVSGKIPGGAVLTKALFLMSRPIVKSIPQGAATNVFCAIAPVSLLAKGGYHADCNAFDDIASPLARDEAAAQKLFESCEALLQNPKAMKL